MGEPLQETPSQSSTGSESTSNHEAALETPAGMTDEELIAEIGREATWQCPGCGESVPSNFEVCWKCLMTETGEQTTPDQPETQATNPESLPVVETDEDQQQDANRSPDRHCKHCGSARQIPDVRVVDRAENSRSSLQVVVYGDPGALIFKNPQYEDLTATICGDCGHVELRVDNARELYHHYLASKK